MSQLLGYTGPISAEQLAALKASGYLPDDLLGKTGLEASYEEELRGTYGSESVERDAPGRKIQVLQTVSEAKAGDSLTLTIDTQAQKDAEKALRWAMSAVGIKRGTVIAMNPQNGEILAMVSLPTYDNNQFARGISNKEYQKLLSNPDKPLINHATQAWYPPGSTYKLVTGTGAIADGKVTANTQVATKGFLTLGTTKFYDWNHRGFGPCDIYCGFGHSSDTYFFTLAGKLGIDRLAYWAEQYGFGSPTGIDLPGEVGGIVPSNEWKQDTLGAEIFPGETYQAGIGQGYDVVTPLQLINAYAALANGGTLYKPHLVKDIVGPDGQIVRSHRADHPPQDGRQAQRPEDDAQCGPLHRHAPAHLQPGRPAHQDRRQVRHRRVRDPGPTGSTAVPLLVRGLHARRSLQGVVRQDRFRSSSSSRSPTTPGPRATRRPRS